MQSENAVSPILVTLLGIVMFVKFEQPENILSPIVVQPSANTALVSFELPNTLEPTSVMLFGIVIVVIFVP